MWHAHTAGCRIDYDRSRNGYHQVCKGTVFKLIQNPAATATISGYDLDQVKIGKDESAVAVIFWSD